MLPAEVARGRQLAFKTGTSYGFRDAWAVGYSADVTIAVWAGRADGTPLPGQHRPRHRRAGAVQDRRPAGAGARPSAPEPPPEGALQVAARELPLALRTLTPGPPNAADAGAPAHPLSAGRCAARMGTREAVPLEAGGGSGPLRWLVDGRPLAPGAPRRTLYWEPTGLGFAQLTVIDGERPQRPGHRAARAVRML